MAAARDGSWESSKKPQSRKNGNSTVETMQIRTRSSNDEPRSTGIRRPWSAARAGPYTDSVSASVAFSRAVSRLETLQIEELRCLPWAEQLGTQVFSHDAALSDPDGQEHVTPLQFSHFLSDAGLIGNEVRRHQTNFDFGPAARVLQAQKRVMGARHSSSSGADAAVEQRPRRPSCGPAGTL